MSPQPYAEQFCDCRIERHLDCVFVKLSDVTKFACYLIGKSV
jgi:hypothetical protein